MTFIAKSLTARFGRDSKQGYLGHLSQDQEVCWVVADGLNLKGNKGGEMASRLAVEAILESFGNNPKATPKAIRKHLDKAQKAILNQQQTNPSLAFAPGSAVLLVADKGEAIWGRVGNSRLFAFMDGRLVSETEDHSVSQNLAIPGEMCPEDIRFQEDCNHLLHTLGQEGELRPIISEKALPLGGGNVFLLCTDGFWEQVTEAEMEVDLLKVITPDEWLEKMQMRLLCRALASEAPEPDNYTALAVFVED